MPLLLALSAVGGVRADSVRFATATEWSRWSLDRSAVVLTPSGITPLSVRRSINASANASEFGGSVKAGSNPAQAATLVDGDFETGWAPAATVSEDQAWVEIDLGRAVTAHRVVLHFDGGTLPFELFDLLLSTGEPQTDNINAPIPGTLVYRTGTRFKENRQSRVTLEFDDPADPPIRYLRIQALIWHPESRLVEVEVEAMGDNLALNLLDRGGGIDIVVDVGRSEDVTTLGNAIGLADGDLFTQWRHGTAARSAANVWAQITLDLGAAFWVDWVRIIGGVVARPFSRSFEGVVVERGLNRRRWSLRFYEVLTSDGSMAPDGSLIWTRHFAGEAGQVDRDRGMADHPFASLPARFIRIGWLFWNTQEAISAQGTTEELQIYGVGVAREVAIRSPLIDLQEARNLIAVRWEAETPPGTRLEVRSRSGNEIRETLTYHDKDGKEVTARRWGRLIPSFRGPIDTSIVAGGDWSPWSDLYHRSGDLFQSPSPRRYLELDTRLVTDDPAASITLKSLEIEFGEPLAERVVGEVAPAQAQPGEATEFTLYLLPSGGVSGFDRITVESSAAPSFVAVRVGDLDIDTPLVSASDRGFTVSLGRAVKSEELVELRLSAAMYVQSTRFDLFIEDSDRRVRQSVDPGDATDLAESGSLSVRLPVSADLLHGVTATPAVITPNGDGVNDVLLIDADLINVLELRPFVASVHDLSGREVWRSESEHVAGPLVLRWAGDDTSGRRVPPGIYLLRIEIAGDGRRQAVTEIVRVAY